MIPRILSLLLSLPLVVPLAPCLALQNPASKPAACTLTAEDYAVFAAVIGDLGKPEDPEEAWHGREILIEDTTANGSDNFKSQAARTTVHKGWGFRSASQAAPGEETVADLEANVDSECPLTDSFGDPKSHSIVSKKEIDGFFHRNGGGWAKFDEKHPHAAGFWEISRPGYNKAGDEALLYLGHYCGALCGTGHLVFLKKENGQWRIENRLMLWIA